MALTFVLDPDLTHDLRDLIVALWVDVTNAGGAVGFVAPVEPADVWPLAEQTFAGVTDGPDHLLAAYDGEALVSVLFLTDNRFALKAHWRVLKRVMVSPTSQGRGHGGAIMREATDVARKLGLEALLVTVRAGTHIEDFYTRLGYREVGRIPRALRVGPGDDRDEIIMWLPVA